MSVDHALMTTPTPTSVQVSSSQATAATSSRAQLESVDLNRCSVAIVQLSASNAPIKLTLDYWMVLILTL